jgi:hypothetical protein
MAIASSACEHPAMKKLVALVAALVGARPSEHAASTLGIAGRYAKVVSSVPRYEAEMARQLLAEAGIPCLVHGPDFDRAELGASHDMVRHVDVYVEPADLERAKAKLAEAWGPEPEP